MQKLVSIGMPTRNHAHFIHNALDSLLAQTYQNIELILLDGASDDNTHEVGERYAKKDSRVRFIKSDSNGGFLKDFGKVLDEAKGEYFMWAADDDWWHPKFVERMVDVLEKSDRHGVAMSHFSEHFDYKYDPLKIGKVFKHNFTDKNHSAVYKKMIAANMNPIFFHGLYRRNILTGLYSRLIPDCIDGFAVFMCEAALSAHFYSVEEVLHSKYRNPTPLPERHEFIGKTFGVSLPHTRYYFMMFKWLISSSNIPLYRKHLILMPWLARIWKSKRVLIKELTKTV